MGDNLPSTFNGQTIPFLGGDLNAPAGSVITATPWLPDIDGVANFFETGRTMTNNVAIVGSNKEGDFRFDKLFTTKNAKKYIDVWFSNTINDGWSYSKRNRTWEYKNFNAT